MAASLLFLATELLFLAAELLFSLPRSPIRGSQGRIRRAHANPHSHPPRKTAPGHSSRHARTHSPLHDRGWLTVKGGTDGNPGVLPYSPEAGQIQESESAVEHVLWSSDRERPPWISVSGPC
ncbi:hypothetical protein ZEAMMB73_Zm00001d045178 [Zea mays]|uniref:Uncharacterized protein n=1 Tax=Zea mays TaxID=4577 RepID=A0A1D6NU83_MAIZE|nr:hypothetical protein ZEAMMB73_Zm00001d045178 [Zea mays]